MGRLILIGVGVVFLGIIALAQVPNQFEGGNPISASRVNENFNYLANLVSGGGYTGMMICTNHSITAAGSELGEGVSYFSSCSSSKNDDLRRIKKDSTQYSDNVILFSEIVEKGYIYVDGFSTCAGTSNNCGTRFIFIKTK